MTTSYHSNNSVDETSIASVATGGILSGRRPVWIVAFALFSTGMIVSSPGMAIATALVLGLSVSYMFAANAWPDKLGTGSKVYPLAGALLAAALLWIAILAGANMVAALGLSNSGIFVASAISLALYVGLIIGEFALAILVQLFISRNRDAAVSAAIVINSKYAGLLGEVR